LFVAFIDGSAEKLNGGMHSEQRATWSTPNPGGNESGDGEGFHCMTHEHTQQPRGLRWHAPGGGRATEEFLKWEVVYTVSLSNVVRHRMNDL
jgi:hypothetical protein